MLALILVTLSLNLPGQLSGQNRFETATLTNLENFPTPWQRAVNAPYLMLAYLFGKIFNDPLLGARITSAIFCFLAAVCLFTIVRFWFKTRIALVASLLFITSSWTLYISHHAIELAWITLAPLLIILTLTYCLKSKKHSALAFNGFAAALALAAYAPYGIWVALITLVILIIKGRDKLASIGLRHIITAALIYFVLLSVLFVSLAHHPGQIKELMGIPNQLPDISLYVNNYLGVYQCCFLYSEKFPELHLGNLPLLDAFSGAMLLLGLFYFVKRLPRRSSLIFLSSFILLLLVLPLNPNYQLMAAIILPFIYIAIASGIVELLNRWFEYFPRNPLVRNVGVTILVVAIGFVCYFHLQKYYIAWPNSAETKAVYMVKSKE